MGLNKQVNKCRLLIDQTRVRTSALLLPIAMASSELPKLSEPQCSSLANGVTDSVLTSSGNSCNDLRKSTRHSACCITGAQ